MGRTVVVSLLVTGLLMLAVPLQAADSTRAEVTAMAIGAPPEMKQIAMLEGTWDAAMQVRMAQEAPWTEAKAVCVYKSILDGCALEQTFTGDMAGLQINGTGLTCFDRTSGKWQASWIDNMVARLSIYEGDFKAGRLVVSGVDKMPGMTVLSRISTFNITPARFDWMTENSFDNGATWVETMKAVFTKR
jgi:hypothetical protein